MTILALSSIRTDGGTQLRAKTDDAVIEDYRNALVGGASFPPVTVFSDGQSYWLADGFYRYSAYRKAGYDSIPVDVREGGQRDALLYAAGANATHGLRRSNADKERAVETLLADKEWAEKSDRWIAEKAAVSPTFVGKLRRKARPQVSTVDTSNGDDEADAPKMSPVDTSTPPPSEPPAPATRTGRDGRKYPAPAPAAPPESAGGAESADGADGDLSWGQDALKRRVPKKLETVFGQRQEFRRAVLLLGKAGKAVERLGGTPAGACLRAQEVQAAIRKAKEAINSAAPHTTCPYCRARKPACDACRGRGWVDRVTFKAAPEEAKG
jgi:hypothetical protein